MWDRSAVEVRESPDRRRVVGGKLEDLVQCLAGPVGLTLRGELLGGLNGIESAHRRRSIVIASVEVDLSDQLAGGELGCEVHATRRLAGGVES